MTSVYRSRAFLNLAHGVDECQHCGRYTPGCEPAHENTQEAGKGFGHKSRDLHAALCHACHAWLDQGRGRDPTDCFDGTREDKLFVWTRAFKRTIALYLARGLLKVA